MQSLINCLGKGRGKKKKNVITTLGPCGTGLNFVERTKHVAVLVV